MVKIPVNPVQPLGRHSMLALLTLVTTLQTASRSSLIRGGLLCLVLSTLSACGGGGGGSNRGGTTPPVANNAPVSSFTMSTTSGIAPLLLTVDGSGSSDSDGSV